VQVVDGEFGVRVKGLEHPDCGQKCPEVREWILARMDFWYIWKVSGGSNFWIRVVWRE